MDTQDNLHDAEGSKKAHQTEESKEATTPPLNR